MMMFFKFVASLLQSKMADVNFVSVLFGLGHCQNVSSAPFVLSNNMKETEIM